MPKALHECAEWDDDEIMDVMFAPFRATRDINPHSWDSKLKFWNDFIVEDAKLNKHVLVDNEFGQLPQTFERKQMVPVCLDQVLQDMLMSKQIATFDDFNLSKNSSWISWGMNTLVAKPLKWSFSRLYLLDNNTQVNNKFVILSLLKTMCDDVLSQYHSNPCNEKELGVIEFSRLMEICSDICAAPEDLLCVLKQLQYEKKALIIYEGDKQLIKFAEQASASVKSITQIDKDIMKLREGEDRLNEEIKLIKAELDKLRMEAKKYLSIGKKDLAKQCLRKKKKLDKMVENRETALENIDAIVLKIKDTESNKMIVDAYKAGTSAYRLMGQKYGLDSDNIDNIVTNVQDMFQKDDEINQSFNLKRVDDTSSLEQELDDILYADNMCNDTFDLNLPDVPTYDPKEALLASDDNIARLKKQLYAS